MSTSEAEPSRCEGAAGAARVCAARVRYNYWQSACRVDIRDREKELIRQAVSLSFPLHLLPDQL